MSTNLRQCKQCGKLLSTYSELCSECSEKRDKDFILIKDYIYDYPEANVSQIAKDTKVEEKVILYFLKEGRLTVKSEDTGLKCEKCGKIIHSGRFCGMCKLKLENSLNSVMPAKQPSKQSNQSDAVRRNAKMHFNYRKK